MVKKKEILERLDTHRLMFGEVLKLTQAQEKINDVIGVKIDFILKCIVDFDELIGDVQKEIMEIKSGMGVLSVESDISPVTKGTKHDGSARSVSKKSIKKK